MRGLSGAAVKKYYNPVAVSFTEWGNWEQAIVQVSPLDAYSLN